MKKHVFAILLTTLCVLLSACGATPDKSGVAETVTEDIAAATYDDGGTVAETPEAMESVETASETDFGTLAGTWYADESVSVLTVYGNGGFELTELADTYEGYLVYTDADGDSPWETGARYELYLENNERMPERFFTFDDGQPGKLVYVVGGGAELFSRGDSAYDDNGVVLRVRWADDSLTDVDEFVAHSGEYEVGIVFTTERPAVQNFKVLSISLEEVDNDVAVYSVLELYSRDALTPERPLLVRTTFPGDMPSNGICCTDDDGQTRYFSVSESGFDGSLILNEFVRSETP